MQHIRLIAAALALAAAPLAAQQPAHPTHARGERRTEKRGMTDDMMPMMREMMGPMMRAIAYTPDHLLSRKDSLRLTADQVTKLTAIRDAAKTAHDAAAADAKMHMGELGQAFQSAAPDEGTLRTHFEAAHAAMGKAHWAMLSAAAQARAVLTDAQRARVDGWVAAMERHEEHGEHEQMEKH